MKWFLFLLATLVGQNTNTYFGPNQKTQGLVRVQIVINDDPNPAGPQIGYVRFDGTNIPLKPRDVRGFRGQASFQKKPSTYRLKWQVVRDKSAWPRTEIFEQEVTLDPRDLWVEITIIGEKASIS